MSVVLTGGETMALIDPLEAGPLQYGSRLELRVAGAESNFAIALSRLGIAVSWISNLGCDPFGDLVLTALKSEGVDISRGWTRPDSTDRRFLQMATRRAKL